MRFYHIVGSSLLLVSLSAEVSGQEPASEVSQQVSAASKIRVRLVRGGWGTLDGPAIDSVTLSYTGSRFLNRRGGNVQLAAPLPMAQVAQIQVPRGSHAGRGAQIGGTAGLGLSLLMVAAMASDPWLSPTTGEAVGFAVGGTVMGVGLGALIGSTSRRWTTVYRAGAP
jgi:hypothetical protein